MPPTPEQRDELEALDWLAERQREERAIQQRTFWAAIIAAGVGVASLGVAIATLWFTIWPRH